MTVFWFLAALVFLGVEGKMVKYSSCFVEILKIPLPFAFAWHADGCY